ncbi:MAG: zf-HC2 domain-containing protein [Polyangiaceae bacterium]|nr:zf-HC2 domain-containing protein [Polyangiaceae bacterium]
MDCEKFDHHVMDALYGELDELTFEALKRHVEGCARCSAVWSGLKNTRAAVALPLEEPPMGLEARILVAEKAAHHRAPWHRKIMRAAAWAGSHAMRPQLAMAALFMFVIGSSLLLLRSGPSAPVTVSEQGRPESASTGGRLREEDTGMARPSPIAGAKGDAARESYGAPKARAGAAEPEAATLQAPAGAAQEESDATVAEGSKGGSAQGLLDESEKTLRDSGCEAAIPKLEGVASQYPSTAEGKKAKEALAACRAQPKATATTETTPVETPPAATTKPTDTTVDAGP